jgi:hypothetical protein
MKTDETGRMIEFDEFPELETKRLVLRRMTLADTGFYLRHSELVEPASDGS